MVANCVGCHKIGDVGKEFGPDLVKLDQEIEVKVLSVDREKEKIALGLKQQREVVEVDGDVRVIGAVARLVDGERAPHTCWPPLIWISAPFTYDAVSVHST